MHKLECWRGTLNQCLYYCQERDTQAMVRGDDFIMIANESNHKWAKEDLMKLWSIKCQHIAFNRYNGEGTHNI